MVLMVSFDHIFFKKKLFFQNLFSCKNKKLSIEERERDRERERERERENVLPGLS